METQATSYFLVQNPYLFSMDPLSPRYLYPDHPVGVVYLCGLMMGALHQTDSKSSPITPLLCLFINPPGASFAPSAADITLIAHLMIAIRRYYTALVSSD